MAARKAKTAPKKCPDCTGAGETAETVRVGSRKLRDTDHQQAALCLTCFGTGEATT
ncbi:hypothetical protein L1085_023620 [Streptomyces sp. MSC1_001]|jgi:DnaJ-class molecular chaperone|uniref:hypothetical protein n=1 Tax=Streptomyces sp. MSC1_001 TaxID=2909263 RepID=UPI00202F7278|nr:hypothetical protein [Streptomyces sp. MSC1_001]